MTTIIGILGAAIILTLFLFNRFDKIKTNSFLYDCGNFIGAFLLVIYAHLLSSYPFLILNSIWAFFSLKEVVKYLKTKSKS